MSIVNCWKFMKNNQIDLETLVDVVKKTKSLRINSMVFSSLHCVKAGELRPCPFSVYHEEHFSYNLIWRRKKQLCTIMNKLVSTQKIYTYSAFNANWLSKERKKIGHIFRKQIVYVCCSYFWLLKPLFLKTSKAPINPILKIQ